MADDDTFLQRFKSQAFHGNLQSALNTSIAILDKPAGIPNLPAVQRLRRGIEKAISMLTEVDAPLVGSSLMGELNNGANSLLQQINAFASNKSPGHLNNANDNLDTAVVPAIARMPKAQSGADVTQIFDSLNLERSNWQKAFDELQETRNEYMQGATAVLEERNRVDAAIQQQEARITEIVKRSDDAIAQLNARASEAERTRDKNFTDTAAKLTEDVAALRANTESTLAKQQQAFTDESKGVIAELRNYRDQARQLLQIIGDTGVSAPFDTTARQDRRAAFALRCLAGAFFSGMAAIVIWAASQLARGMEFHWEFMLFRYMTAAILAIPAYYFAREASKFQDEADRNRRIQLELASIGPFIDALDDAKKTALREELTRTYFRAESVSRELEKPFDVNGLVDALKEAIKNK